jgi:uncharacterized protein YcfJ
MSKYCWTKCVFVFFSLTNSVNSFTADYTDMATITWVHPRMETINAPRQSCQLVQESIPQERSVTGAVIGGVAGAIIGSQVGGGSARIASGAVGAGVGAIVGDRIDNSNNGITTRQVERCSLIDNYQQVVRGYDVTYQYQNRTFQTYMTTPVKEGDAIRLKVNVTPY